MQRCKFPQIVYKLYFVLFTAPIKSHGPKHRFTCQVARRACTSIPLLQQTPPKHTQLPVGFIKMQFVYDPITPREPGAKAIHKFRGGQPREKGRRAAVRWKRRPPPPAPTSADSLRLMLLTLGKLGGTFYVLIRKIH